MAKKITASTPMIALPPVRYSDMQNRIWFERYMSPRIKPYGRLMRLDKPIGTWLLLIPCWWSLSLADPRGPDLLLMTLFAVGAILMRGAGCVVNDIYDRDLDRQVERTRTRPLASGRIPVWAAGIFLVALLLLAAQILWLLNRPTIILGVLSLLLVFTYPLMKRITWWPQLFLGLTFNWGIWMGWTASTGGTGTLTTWWPPILLYISGIFWTLGYDTIYAHQDIQDDALIGIRSTARLFGTYSRKWVGLFYILALWFITLSGWAAGEGRLFYALMLLAVLHALYQWLAWKSKDPANCLQRFQANRDFGLIVLIAIIAGKWG